MNPRTFVKILWMFVVINLVLALVMMAREAWSEEPGAEIVASIRMLGAPGEDAWVLMVPVQDDPNTVAEVWFQNRLTSGGFRGYGWAQPREDVFNLVAPGPDGQMIEVLVLLIHRNYTVPDTMYIEAPPGYRAVPDSIEVQEDGIGMIRIVPMLLG